mmetsp:Transcript_17923/g.32423  ORF Transcript_17923/g.32423 Transcript_17923/m.32423 type:complete len:228 (+) Transcript_17923:1894-2577(+)
MAILVGATDLFTFLTGSWTTLPGPQSRSTVEIFLSLEFGLERVMVLEGVLTVSFFTDGAESFDELGAMISRSSSLSSSSLLSSSKSSIALLSAGFSIFGTSSSTMPLALLVVRRGPSLFTSFFTSTPSFLLSCFTSTSTAAISLSVRLSNLFIRNLSINPTRFSIRFIRTSSQLVSNRAAMRRARCRSCLESWGPALSSFSSLSPTPSSSLSASFLVGFFSSSPSAR